MKILITVPDHQYYLWQMLVQINNFRNYGFESDVIYLIGKTNSIPSETLNNIVRNGGFKCKFFIFEDVRVNKGYSVSLRPYLVKRFFKEHPEMEKEIYFYTDPDVIFINEKIEFGDMLTDNVWYISDTASYLNTSYIKSKGEELFIEMCDIVGVSPEVVVKNDLNAGGAQLLIKNTNSAFWEKVELDSLRLFEHMISTSHKYTPEFPIQAWTAEMWSTLWNAWLFGHETKTTKVFDFSWATDEIERWNQTSIYHNAGVADASGDNGRLFSKIAHQISPFNKELTCSEEYCSFNYVKEIKNTEKNLKKIIY